VQIFLTQLAIKVDLSISHLTECLFLHYLGKTEQAKYVLQWTKKSIDFTSLVWAPTAGRLQGLTVIQQCVYQMTFKSVDVFKKRLVKSGLVRSRTLGPIDTAINERRKRLSAGVLW